MGIDKDNRKLQIFLWVLAGLVVFSVLLIFGWKVLYGYVVPQANDVSGLTFLGLVAFAALAGIIVNFGPCSLAVLPAYMAFYLGLSDKKARSPVARSIMLGAIASIGVVGFYIVLGLLFASVGTALAAYAPQVKLLITVLIFVFGVMLFRGKAIHIGMLSRFKDAVGQASQKKSQVLRLIGFGVVYGAGGLSCFLPIFLPLIFYPFIGGLFFQSIASFIVFSLFQALFLIGATVLVGMGKQKLLILFTGKAEFIQKLAGGILIITSVIMFTLFLILGM